MVNIFITERSRRAGLQPGMKMLKCGFTVLPTACWVTGHSQQLWAQVRDHDIRNPANGTLQSRAGRGGVVEMAMYFVQHGLALTKEENLDRALSAEGREEVECISAHLRKAGVTVKIVCHSGKTRARETAQILADQICPNDIRNSTRAGRLFDH